MTAGLMIVQRKYKNFCSKGSPKQKSKMATGWMFNNLYYGTKAFTTGSTDESDTPSTAEKLILVGFSVFTLM